MPKPHISRRSRAPTGPSAGPFVAARTVPNGMIPCGIARRPGGRGHGALSRDLLEPRLGPSRCKLIRPAATVQYSRSINLRQNLDLGGRPATFWLSRHPQGGSGERGGAGDLLTGAVALPGPLSPQAQGRSVRGELLDLSLVCLRTALNAGKHVRRDIFIPVDALKVGLPAQLCALAWPGDEASLGGQLARLGDVVGAEFHPVVGRQQRPTGIAVAGGNFRLADKMGEDVAGDHLCLAIGGEGRLRHVGGNGRVAQYVDVLDGPRGKVARIDGAPVPVRAAGPAGDVAGPLGWDDVGNVELHALIRPGAYLFALGIDAADGEIVDFGAEIELNAALVMAFEGLDEELLLGKAALGIEDDQLRL